MILTTNTPYPSRKIRRIRACTHQRPQRKKGQYPVSRKDQYAVFDIWHVNILEDIKRGLYSKKLQYAIQRISLTRLPAQSVGSSNINVLDSPCLLVLITGTSQSRQHVITSLIHIESCKSPTAELFEVDSGRIFIRYCEY
ncbi:hypothetical protein Tco_1227008 [Tanacetum coccineum]